MSKSLIDSRFKHNVLFTYGTQLLGLATGFATITIITRHAGVSTYGQLSTMAALSGVATNLISFRTNEAVVAFYKRGAVEGDLGSCRLALGAGLFLDLVTGLVLLTLMLLGAPLIAQHLLKSTQLSPDVAAYSAVMLSGFLRGTPIALLGVQERFRLINVVGLAEQVLKMVLLAALAWTEGKLTLHHIVYATLVPAMAVTISVYFGPVVRLVQLRHAMVPRHRITEYARFSMSTFVSSTLKAGNQNIESVILGYLTKPDQVGIYNLFRQFLRPVGMLSAPVSTQIYPRFMEAVVAQRLDVVRETITHANRLLLRGFLGLLLVIVPALVLYGRWNGICLSTAHYAGFAFMVGNALVLQQLWWCRPFSVVYNPNLSVKGNLMYTAASLLLLPSCILWAGFLGVGLAQFLAVLVLMAFWGKSMKSIYVAYPVPHSEGTT